MSQHPALPLKVRTRTLPAALGLMACLQPGLAWAASQFFALPPPVKPSASVPPPVLSMPGMASPGAQCRAAIAQAEQAVGIPAQLLASIARVESGRRDPKSGVFAPWPWTANAEGQGFFFESKAEAVAAIRKMRADGVRSIDVGCLQVNLMHHPDAFTTLEAAFDPMQNAAYAAKFLNDLHTQSGDWAKAAALYHSANPEFGEPYQRKVLAAWPDEKRLAGEAPSSGFAWGSGAARPAFGVDRTAFAAARHNDATANPLMPAAAPGGLMASPGRGLDAYRAAPIAMISRIRRFGG
jgi:hypothetical protein